MSNPYAPPGESGADLWLEQSNLVGAVLGGVAYGIHVAVFAECFFKIQGLSRASMESRPRAGLLAFIFLLFAMGTINLGCNTKMIQLMFIDNRAYPGGPNAWFMDHYSSGINTAGNASYIIANFLADGLLLWRAYVVWDSNIWIIIFPCITYLASTAMSIMVLFQSSRPTASLWTHTTVQFTLPYFTISISLNIILTILLVARLLHMSLELRRSLSREHAATYVSIAAMLIESAAPYALAGLIFIISYARNSNVQNLVLPVLSQIMCISPEVIILRVATGRAVSAKSTKAARDAEATLEFRAHKSELTSDFGPTLPAVSGLTDSATIGSQQGSFKEEV